MRPADLTPVEIADLLDTAFRHDRDGAGAGLTLAERSALADYLGCHEEAREAAWEAWKPELELSGRDPGDAEYWLDVEFIEPCPGDHRT